MSIQPLLGGWIQSSLQTVRRSAGGVTEYVGSRAEVRVTVWRILTFSEWMWIDVVGERKLKRKRRSPATYRSNLR